MTDLSSQKQFAQAEGPVGRLTSAGDPDALVATLGALPQAPLAMPLQVLEVRPGAGLFAKLAELFLAPPASRRVGH